MKQKIKRLIIFLLVAATLLGGLYQFGHKSYMNWAYKTDYKTIVEGYCKAYDLDPNLVYAVMKTESGFDPKAKSDVGAIGLMQMTEETFVWLKPKVGDHIQFKDLYTPEFSIRYGTFYLSYLLDRYDGDETNAVAAYHAGVGSVKKWLKDPSCSSDHKHLSFIPSEATSYYVTKVAHAKQVYTQRGEV